MISGLGTAIRDTYGVSFVLFGTAVGLWVGAAVVELAQHVVEWELGMFAANASIEAAVESDAYRAAGWAKVAAVPLCSWLVPRYLYQERDWRRVFRPDWPLARGLAVMAGIGGLPIVLPLLVSGVGGMDPDTAALWGLLAGLALTVPLMAVMPWGVGLLAGDASMTFAGSVRAMRGRWFWATFLMFGCALPLLIAHAALNLAAIGASPLVAGTLLVLDSVLVGFVALVLGSAGWMIYRIRVLDALS